MALPKFAMITADKRCGKIEELGGDFWNMFYWLLLMDGYHYSFEGIRDKMSELDKYDIIMMSGNPGYIEEIIEIAEKTKAVTMFFPEGDVSLYHDKGIQPKVVAAWNACSLFASVEEDKIPYYESLCVRPVKFIHVPVPNALIYGDFFTGRNVKNSDILIYGDNNPNNPIVALGVARRLRKSVSMTAISIETAKWINSYLGIKVSRVLGKVDQFYYLSRLVALSRVLVYPTRWIGTSRQVISGAVCGTPVVGNRDGHTQKRLFPMLGTYMYDTDKMCELVERLYIDDKFYDECAKYAFNEVKFYSEANAVKRFLNAYESVRREK